MTNDGSTACRLCAAHADDDADVTLGLSRLFRLRLVRAASGRSKRRDRTLPVPDFRTFGHIVITVGTDPHPKHEGGCRLPVV